MDQVQCEYYSAISEYILLHFVCQYHKWLAVKTASEMTYTVSGGALKLCSTSTCYTRVVI